MLRKVHWLLAVSPTTGFTGQSWLQGSDPNPKSQIPWGTSRESHHGMHS